MFRFNDLHWSHIAKKLAHHIRTYPAANAVMAPALPTLTAVLKITYQLIEVWSN